MVEKQSNEDRTTEGDGPVKPGEVREVEASVVPLSPSSMDAGPPLIDQTEAEAKAITEIAPADFKSTRTTLDRLLRELEEEELELKQMMDLTSAAGSASLREFRQKAKRLWTMVDGAYQHAIKDNDWCDNDQYIALGEFGNDVSKKVKWADAALADAEEARRQAQEMFSKPPEESEPPPNKPEPEKKTDFSNEARVVLQIIQDFGTKVDLTLTDARSGAFTVTVLEIRLDEHEKMYREIELGVPALISKIQKEQREVPQDLVLIYTVAIPRIRSQIDLLRSIIEDLKKPKAEPPKPPEPLKPVPPVPPVPPPPEIVPMTEDEIHQEIEKHWRRIQSSEAPTKGSTAIDDNVRRKTEILELAAKLPNPDHEMRKWDIKLNIFNAYLLAAGKDSMQELASAKADLRSSLSGQVQLNEIREYIDMPEVRPVLEMVENIFFAGTIKFVGLDGRPLIHPKTGLSMLENGMPVEHNYAMAGNPDDREYNDGKKLKFDEYLAALLKDRGIPESDIFINVLVAIICELRSKTNAVYYSLYSRTPLTFELKPIEQAATLAFVFYKIRSGGYVRPEYMRFFSSVALPRDDAGELETVVVDSKSGGRTCLKGDQVLRSARPDIPTQIMANPGGDSKNDDQAKNAFEARRVADGLLSSEKLPTAMFGHDHQHMPMMWDVLLARDGGANFSKLNFQKYEEVCVAWLAFLKQMEQIPEIRKVGQITTACQEGIGKYSANKGMLPAVEGSPYAEIYKDLLKALYLRYFKDLFDQFNKGSDWQDEMARREKYIELAREAIKNSGTFPGFLSDYLLKEVFYYVQMPNVKAALLGKGAREKSRYYKGIFSSHRSFFAKRRANFDKNYLNYYTQAGEKKQAESEK